MKRAARFLWYLLRYGLLAAVLSIAFANAVVLRASNHRLFSSVEAVPHNRVGLLLGTSPYLPGGRVNPFFVNRIAAAAELYLAGKVEVVVASGDNEHRSYNEPAHMQEALLEAGVPPEAIMVDAAGFRTLDSVVRMESVFGLRQFTVISQEFHNRRALFIAKEFSLDAVAYNARDVGGYSGLRTMAREHLARTLAVLDVYLLGTRPRSGAAAESVL